MLLACNNDKSSTNEEASSTSARDTSTSASTKKTILFFGNSLTAGYGLDPSEAFPALIQARIDSLKLPYTVVNAGVSGETSAGGNGRIDWVLRQPVAVFVLELGGNDGLRGIPLEETRKNLQAIIDKVRAKYPETKIVLAGMQIPPNLGQSYTQEFSRLYPELAQKNNLTLIPFLLEGVGGEARLNLQDGIHPTAEGHRLVADNVWEVLEGVL
nr:arylesterase [Rhabdobacter roseus]